MFIYALTTPIDAFDGLTPLPRWLADGDDHQAAWALSAVLALADAAEHVGWRGDMRHLPAAGAMPTPGHATPFLVVKQDTSGATFVISGTEMPWLAEHSDRYHQVAARRIGAWPPDTRADREDAEGDRRPAGTGAIELIDGHPF